MECPRILLADDQQEMVAAVIELLRGKFDIVGAVENGERLLEAADLNHPDLIILDVSMPVLNGMEAALRLKKSGATAKIIFLTVHDDPDFVEAALLAGALGYVLKGRVATDLLLAIHEVLANRIFISPMSAVPERSLPRRPVLTVA
jgi:DNA-binding NarL/FixJ family response regulator